MQPDGVFVENFAIRQRSPEEVALVLKVSVEHIAAAEALPRNLCPLYFLCSISLDRYGHS